VQCSVEVCIALQKKTCEIRVGMIRSYSIHDPNQLVSKSDLQIFYSLHHFTRSFVTFYSVLIFAFTVMVLSGVIFGFCLKLAFWCLFCVCFGLHLISLRYKCLQNYKMSQNDSLTISSLVFSRWSLVWTAFSISDKWIESKTNLVDWIGSNWIVFKSTETLTSRVKYVRQRGWVGSKGTSSGPQLQERGHCHLCLSATETVNTYSVHVAYCILHV
jgi:hypothetical protein